MTKKNFWEGLLEEVTKAKHKSRLRAGLSASQHSTAHKNNPKRRSKPIYVFIGNALPCPLITVREADCLLHFAQGKTIRGTAEALALSPRTVESYLNSMKHKLQCQSKSDFVQKIIANVCLDDVRQQLETLEESTEGGAPTKQ